MKNIFSFQSNNKILAKRHDTGLILHLYYPEMWEEILSYLTNLGEDFDLFVTIPYEVNFSENQITSKYPDAHIYRCENRGRDVAPFLAIFALISGLGYKYLCKIHTKRNMQPVPEVNWRQDVLLKLLGSPQIILDIKAAFDNHTDWGMVAPQGHVVPSNYFWQQNSVAVTELAQSVGIQTKNMEFLYVAGTMFWFRPQALDLVLRTDIDFQKFVPEQGQQDATLAHAFERFFGLAATAAGYTIAESDSYTVRPANVSLHFRALAGFYEDLLQEDRARGDHIQSLEKHIISLQGESEARNQHILSLEHYIGSLKEENGELKEENGELKEEIRELKEENGELKEEIRELKEEISSIYKSSSWRITRPLRDLKTITQKVFLHSHQQVAKTGIPRLRRTPAINQAKEDDANVSLAPRQPSRKLPFLKKTGEKYKISVVVTSYNHEKYIGKCLDAILMQKGSFDIEVVLGDDCSTDGTPHIMQDYQGKYPDIIRMMPNTANLGVTRNLKRCLDACTGEFIAICEGDDYWMSEEKLQKQMGFLVDHQDLPMCFSALMLLYEPANKLIPHHDQFTLNKDRISTKELIHTNYIGNFSCCMYRADVVRELPPALFDMYTVDWMFNIVCSEWGGVGYIRDWMSVYRIHSAGDWSGKSDQEKFKAWLNNIDIYNRFLNYKYDAEFLELKIRIQSRIK